MLNFGLSLGSSFVQNKANKERKKKKELLMSDGNPERRNLVLLSLSIIVFYIADGEIIGNTLKFQFINIQFNNFQILSNIVMIMLFWFLFRYRLTTLGVFEKEFQKEISNISRGHPVLRRYIKKSLTDYSIQKSQNNKHSEYINYHRDINRGGYRYIYGIKHKTSTQDNEQSMAPINNLWAWLVLIIIWINTAVARPSFSAYIVPYLIFLTALAAPLVF